MDVDTSGGVTQEPPPIRLEQEGSTYEIDDGSQETISTQEGEWRARKKKT